MEGLLDFQHGLDRTYARIVHNKENAAHLKKSDRKEIEFKAKVSEGSSLVEVNLTELAGKFAGELIGKMEPTHLVVMVLGGMLLRVASSVLKKQIERASHDKDLSEETKKSIALSQEETRRIEILASALTSQPRL